MARMIPHAGQLFDDARHARQGPEIGLEPVRARAAAQRRIESSHVVAIEPRLSACTTGSPQAGDALAPPLAIPARDTLPAHTELPSHGCQDELAPSKQPRSLFAPLRQRLEIPSGQDTAVHASIVCRDPAIVTVLCETQ